MYPNSQHVDEPTMTDLRGILPGQRPPADARVLDEPTSEVPIIRPAGPVDTDPEPEATVAGDAVAGDAVAEDAVAEDAVAEDAVAEDAVAEDAVAEDAALVEDAEPAADAAPEGDVEFEVGTEPEPVAAEAAAADVTVPEPAFTPPAMPAFDTDPSATGPESEMAKMAWSPTPTPPPGLIPVADPSPFEPEPVAEVTEPEPDEPAVAEPAVAAPAAGAPEVSAPEVSAPEAAEPAAAAPEAAAPEPAEPEAAEPPASVTETPVAVWSDQAAQQLREQWRDLQVQFIDDPDAAVTGAKNLITEAVRELADTLLAAQAELDPFRGGDQVDTETMRVAMRRYRDFLDRVLAL